MTRIGPFAFGLLSVLVALATLRVMIWPMAMVMPEMTHYLPTLPWAALGHIVFSPLALALMPLQFWAGLRQNRPRLHRVLGYAYVLAILLGAAASIVMLRDFRGSLWAGAGFGLLAVLWIAATLRAVQAARAGDYLTHHRWMLRSASLTFAAVTLRLQLPIMFALGYSLPGAYDWLAWACWVPNLAAVLWWQKQKGTR